MIIFTILCIMSYMIFTLVKNALIGIQLSEKDHYNESIELIIPITSDDFFDAQEWLKALKQYKRLQQNNLRIHFLFDKYHPSINLLESSPQNLSFVEFQTFTLRPDDSVAVPWMIGQIAEQIKGKTIIIGDPEIIPNEHALISAAYHMTKLQRPIFIVPQTAKINPVGEALESLNPTLALISVLGFKKYTKNLTHPLFSISRGWMVMPLSVFNQLSWSRFSYNSWKECISKEWDRSETNFSLGFGEKFLLKYYPSDFKTHVQLMKNNWSKIWNVGNRNGFFLYALAACIWFFPIASFWIFPLWSVASIMLLGLFRFFTKIIFQEKWSSVFLHPISSFILVGGLILWGQEFLRAKYWQQKSTKN